jgi:hypothetical protein
MFIKYQWWRRKKEDFFIKLGHRVYINIYTVYGMEKGESRLHIDRYRYIFTETTWLKQGKIIGIEGRWR